MSLCCSGGGLACPARRLTWSGVQRPPAPFCCAMTASGFPSGTRSARANFHLGTGLRRVVHSVYRPPSTVKSAIAPLTVEPLCRCSDGQTRLRPPAGTSVDRYQPLTNSLLCTQKKSTWRDACGQSFELFRTVCTRMRMRPFVCAAKFSPVSFGGLRHKKSGPEGDADLH